MTAWFTPTKPDAIKAALLREARAALPQHEAHAEYHTHQAQMYRERIARLEGPAEEHQS